MYGMLGSHRAVIEKYIKHAGLTSKSKSTLMSIFQFVRTDGEIKILCMQKDLRLHYTFTTNKGCCLASLFSAEMMLLCPRSVLNGTLVRNVNQPSTVLAEAAQLASSASRIWPEAVQSGCFEYHKKNTLGVNSLNCNREGQLWMLCRCGWETQNDFLL